MLIRNLLHVSCLALAATSAFADGADYIRGRRAFGAGTYTNNNSTTGHSLTINADGRTGMYCVNGSNSCGQLFDIQFNQGNSDVRGQWHFNGSRGTFQWNFLSTKEFDGGFRMHRQGEGVKYIPFDGEWQGAFN